MEETKNTFSKITNEARKSKLEKIISNVNSRLSTGKPMDHVLRELLIPPSKRKVENIELLKLATINIPFFQEMSTQQKYSSQKIHDKICKHMLHARLKRGLPVILKSERI